MRARKVVDIFTRKARTLLPNGTLVERDWSPAEIYALYVRGFRDGACTRAIQDEMDGLGAYHRGYADGRRMTQKACAAEAKRLGYEPTILRTMQPIAPKRKAVR